MDLRLDSRVRLNNGVEMPVFGLGVWEAGPGKPCQDAVAYALSIGYRLIDTARVYNNEEDVGAGIRESGVPREDVFVTTKVANKDQGYEETLRACDASLMRLGLDYVDLYLVHWPLPGKRGDTWRALLRLLEDEKARAIGVSNYMVPHLKELQKSSLVIPAVNQIELHPFLQPREALDFCRKNAIQIEAYSPLTRGRRLDDPAIRKIAAKHEKSPAQVLIRWSLQHGNVVIPKSVRPGRIWENADVFDFSLPAADMEALDALNDGYRTCWDPTKEP